MAFSLITLSISTHAEEDIEPHGPEKITQEQWREINDYIYNHQLCLREEMVKTVEASDDARNASNQILEICSPHLIELKQKMVSWNIAPSFADQYIYTKKNKAANQMLRAVMVLMANKQSVAEQSEESDY